MTPEPRSAGRLRAALWRRAYCLALLAALGLVVVVRAWVPYGEVFRDGHVVLVANDPYRYRFWVEQLLASRLNPFDPWDLAQMPDAVQGNDVMFIWAAWLSAAVLGGGGRSAGLVLAWYPILSAVVTGVLVYALTLRLTEDRRVALVAVVVLALTPAHAYRTMLGFGDHHAFDYVALMLTATALVWLVTMDGLTERRPWRRWDWWLAVFVLGGAVATQSLAWRGGPLLLVPLGVYAAAAAVSGVRAGRSPLLENSGLIGGLLMATGLAALIHLGPNWAPTYRGFAPLLLFGAVAGVLVAGEVAVRFELSWSDAAIGAPLVPVAWLLGVLFAFPSLLDGVQRFRAFIERTPTQRAVGIGETASLFGTAETPLALFGLVLLVALPVMAWVLNEIVREHNPGLLAVSAYAWVFLALSVNRVRFTGQLSLFLSVFAAAGLVWLAGRMELVRRLAPFARRSTVPLLDWSSSSTASQASAITRSAGAVFLLVLLVTGVGVAQVPGTMDRVTVDDETYAAARWMDGYAAEHGWGYPRSYVFSGWGRNLLYNYVVSGESRSYGYARQNYGAFLASSDAVGWYAELEGSTGFVVVRPSAYDYPTDSMQVRLADRHGSAGEGVPGLAHYRLVYTAGDPSLLVFTLVPGATVLGNATANTTVRVATDVRVGDVSFTYRRAVTAAADGRFEVTVPYPGRYSVGGGTVVITDSDVMAGETVEA